MHLQVFFFLISIVFYIGNLADGWSTSFCKLAEFKSLCILFCFGVWMCIFNENLPPYSVHDMSPMLVSNKISE